MPATKRQPEIVKDAWDILVELATRGQTITYGQLAARLARPGYQPIAQSMPNLLNPIMHYCDDRDLPRLNDLVVNRETQRPGYAPPGYDHNASQQKVFAFNWDTRAVNEDDFARR